MPLIRLTKLDPENLVVTPADMALTFVAYDGIAYNFNWTGRDGLLPLSAVEQVLNRNTRQSMLRSVWIAADAENSDFWVPGDIVTILSSRKGSRGAPVALTQTVVRLPISSPYDRIAFAIAAKPAGKLYAIDIMINPIDEGYWGHPEVPVT